MSDRTPSHPSSGAAALQDHDSPVSSCAAAKTIPPELVPIVRMLCSSKKKDGTQKTKKEMAADRVTLGRLKHLKIKLCDPYKVKVRRYEKGEWHQSEQEAGGFEDEETGEVTIVRGQSEQDTAVSLIHESMHVGQDTSLPQLDRDVDARVKTEHWLIAHQLPESEKNFRKDGEPDQQGITKFVKQYYSASHLSNPRAIRWQGSIVDGVDDNGKTRPAQDGDVVQERDPPTNVCAVDSRALDCSNVPSGKCTGCP